MPRLIDQPINLYLRGAISSEEYGSLMVASELNPLEWYCPNGKQEEYIRMVAESCQRACDTFGMSGGTPGCLS